MHLLFASCSLCGKEFSAHLRLLLHSKKGLNIPILILSATRSGDALFVATMSARKVVTLHLQPPTWGMPTCHPDFLQVSSAPF